MEYAETTLVNVVVLYFSLEKDSFYIFKRKACISTDLYENVQHWQNIIKLDTGNSHDSVLHVSWKSFSCKGFCCIHLKLRLYMKGSYIV